MSLSRHPHPKISDPLLGIVMIVSLNTGMPIKEKEKLKGRIMFQSKGILNQEGEWLDKKMVDPHVYF